VVEHAKMMCINNDLETRNQLYQVKTSL